MHLSETAVKCTEQATLNRGAKCSFSKPNRSTQGEPDHETCVKRPGIQTQQRHHYSTPEWAVCPTAGATPTKPGKSTSSRRVPEYTIPK